MIEKSLPPDKVLFVLNPVSGGRDKENVVAYIDTFCREHHLRHKIYKTTGENDESHIRMILSEFSPEIMVAVGGDGTVNQCASIVTNTSCILGIIPLGSGNGLSKDLNIPQNDTEAALSLLLKPSFKSIDTLIANGHFFVHLCDIGFNATIVRSYSMSNRRGLLTYAYYMVRHFISYKSSRYYITVDDAKRFKVRAFMITAANSNRFGSNITINPNGKEDDGIFELIIIKAFPYKELPKLMWQIFWKKIHFSPYSRILSARKVSIIHKRGKTLQVDGEILGRFKRVNIEIIPSSLKVIVPLGK
ncbi:MAG TPA: diacylglycerol kinase family protein [Cytophagales bacterium]|nr:diacylglycerol kinase family protein [Cytophagales bacterium]